MSDTMFVEFMLTLLGLGIATVIARVWKIPAIEQKLDTVIKETDKNRDRIHEINNTLHVHDLRITKIEEAKKERNKPQETSKNSP
jgi:hypothetical protein